MMPWIASILNFFVTFTVLPSTLYPLNGQKLHIRYPPGKWVAPGATIDIEGRFSAEDSKTRTDKTIDTQVAPEISSMDLNCRTRYMLLMLDLDGMIPGTSTEIVVLHWYQPDLVFNCTNHTPPPFLRPDNDTVSDNVAPYVAPQAPPCTHHRYVYFLFEQPSSYRFPDCFAHVPPKTLDARAGFDMREFMRAAGLDAPVAVNYFFGRHNSSDCAPIPSATSTSFRSVHCDAAPTVW